MSISVKRISMELHIQSIQFKEAKKAPKMADLMGMSDEEFKFNKDYVDGILNGTIDPSKLQ